MPVFFLKRLDPATGSALYEARIEIDDPGRLAAALEIEDDDEMTYSYFLDEGDVERVAALFTLPLDLDPDLDYIERDGQTRHAPYLIHTDFELPLMLEGRKPLAVFSSDPESDWFDELKARFAPHIAAATFVERDVTLLRSYRDFSYPVRTLLYAQPAEAWRIQAYLDLWSEGAWDETHERREGELLGYEDWQIDWWLERPWRPKRQPRD
ncbi:hypothetical protein [Rhizobium sp. TRM95796]|uniref:hypothetical protein n=1 Tax=Rhizobium sp. TRM95796 TaxID=2979862 RepID=UPI0021E8D620|nr:hypothetical protein [Rhizobium sp. TRM95796]MCV3766677.1 hypothetical protein [Rhizobium sp. TRM95796]